MTLSETGTTCGDFFLTGRRIVVCDLIGLSAIGGISYRFVSIDINVTSRLIGYAVYPGIPVRVPVLFLPTRWAEHPVSSRWRCRRMKCRFLLSGEAFQ
jgi:hypothetical protein